MLTFNMITGGQARDAPSSSTIDPKTIDLYFQSIKIDDQFASPEVLSIPVGTRIPTIEVHTVWKFLSALVSAPGSNELPFSVGSGGIMLINLRQQSPKYVTPLLKNIWSPQCLWKLANIIPIHKETLFEICNQLRPIPLTIPPPLRTGVTTTCSLFFSAVKFVDSLLQNMVFRLSVTP